MAFEFNPNQTDEERAAALSAEDAKTAPINRWSFSGLKEFESCQYASFLTRVKKFKKEFSGPAAERGVKVHDSAEHFVDGTTGELIPELKSFEKEFLELRDLYADGKVQCEEDWGYTEEWEPTDWKHPDVWLLMKLDAFVQEDETSARVIDYKTGKKFGNEIKHSDQGMLYALGAFMRYPELQFVKVEFWYTDQSDTMIKEFSRERAMILLERYHARGKAMTTCNDFKPQPSTYGCKWCPHKESGNCEWAL